MMFRSIGNNRARLNRCARVIVTRLSSMLKPPKELRYQVNGLKDRNGVLCQTRERVEKIVKEYFWGLFKSTNTEGRAMDAVLSAIEPKLTDEANQTPLSLLLVMR